MSAPCPLKNTQVSNKQWVQIHWAPEQAAPAHYFPSHSIWKGQKGSTPHTRQQVRENGRSLEQVSKGDWLGVLCAPPLQGLDWKKDMLFPRESVESKKKTSVCCFAGRHPNKLTKNLLVSGKGVSVYQQPWICISLLGYDSTNPKKSFPCIFLVWDCTPLLLRSY